MKVKLNNEKDVINVVKRMVFLAYNASDKPLGMGTFQEIRLGGIPAIEEQVWKCAYNEEDYSARFSKSEREVYCDYVFGRMMKWGCQWNKNIIEIREKDFHYDYQSFCHKYKNDKSLVDAALKSLGITQFEIIEESD